MQRQLTSCRGEDPPYTLANVGHYSFALFATLQYSAATISNVLVARLHDGSPWPMAAVIAGCGVLAWCAGRFVVPLAPRAARERGRAGRLSDGGVQ